MSCCYAIYPDSDPKPAAIFADLDEAMLWACARYGNDNFKIKYLAIAEVERAERNGAPGPS